MPRPIQLSVSISAMRSNLAQVRKAVGGTRIWSVVKARAYGHGIEAAAKAFADTDGFALLDLEEAVMLRELGVRQPILLLEGIFDQRDVAVLREYGLSCAVHCREQLELLQALPSRSQVDVFIKLNTGMNRLGFVPAQFRDAWLAARRLPGVGTVGLMTHFANADRFEDGPVSAQAQMALFDQVTADLVAPRTIANSAATARGGAFLRDWVRPGIILYGSSPFGPHDPMWSAKGMGLRATQTLTAKIIGVQQLAAGAYVGYGSRYRAERDMRLGIVACGYADGYPRHAQDGTPVAIDGEPGKLVGRVSMDMLTVDLSEHPHAGIGSSVELWGDQVPIDLVADKAGTIGYELMCAVTPRVPRRTVGA